MCLITYGKFQSVTRKIPTQTHTHTQNHHKYAFASPLFEMSPGNILNATLYILISLSLAQRGGAHTTGSGEIIILWRSAGIRFLYAALSSRVWGDRKMTNVTADGGEWSKRSRTDRRRDRERGRVGRKKKVMVLALSSTPLLQSPRQHAWRALKRGVITDKNNREWVRGNETELDGQCMNESSER